MVEQIHSTVELLLGNPPTQFQKYFLLVLGLLVAYLMFERMNRTLDVRRSDPMNALLVVMLGGAVIVASMILSQQYVLPHVDERFQRVLLFLSPVVGTLAVTVPAMCWIQKASYISATISWSVSIAVVAFFLVIARVGIEAVTTGKASMTSTKERTQEMEKFLEGQ